MALYGVFTAELPVCFTYLGLLTRVSAAASQEYRLMAVEVGFQCDVISCELVRGAAEAAAESSACRRCDADCPKLILHQGQLSF